MPVRTYGPLSQRRGATAHHDGGIVRLLDARRLRQRAHVPDESVLGIAARSTLTILHPRRAYVSQHQFQTGLLPVGQKGVLLALLRRTLPARVPV
jgi:hypothetical protein